jgi:hypothetical protein
MEAIFKKFKELKDQGEIMFKVSFIEVGLLLLIFALELASFAYPCVFQSYLCFFFQVLNFQ